MWHKLLSDASFFRLLLRFDEDLAARARTEGCPCGGVLHQARYPRKPRGLPEEIDRERRDDRGCPHGLRLSFCCDREGCRRRVTPASVRYLGRRVYLGAVVILVTAMRSGVSAGRAARLGELLGVGRRTLERWRGWWRETFVESRFWKHGRARFSPPVDAARIPAALLERFLGSGAEALFALLRFLAPITARARSAGAG